MNVLQQTLENLRKLQENGTFASFKQLSTTQDGTEATVLIATGSGPEYTLKLKAVEDEIKVTLDTGMSAEEDAPSFNPPSSISVDLMRTKINGRWHLVNWAFVVNLIGAVVLDMIGVAEKFFQSTQRRH